MNALFRMLVIGAVVVCIAGLALYLFRQYSESVVSCADVTPSPRIVAFGDSLVARYGAATEGGFVSILSNEAGIAITNLGKNGDTTGQARERLDNVIALKPDITLILLGGNDTLRRVPAAETEENLRSIISEIQKNGSKVLLLGVIGGFPQDPYKEMFERLATEYDVSYVPNVLSGIIGHSSLMSDQVHPNQAGYQKIADRVLPILERECSE